MASRLRFLETKPPLHLQWPNHNASQISSLAGYLLLKWGHWGKEILKIGMGTYGKIPRKLGVQNPSMASRSSPSTSGWPTRPSSNGGAIRKTGLSRPWKHRQGTWGSDPDAHGPYLLPCLLMPSHTPLTSRGIPYGQLKEEEQNSCLVYGWFCEICRHRPNVVHWRGPAASCWTSLKDRGVGRSSKWADLGALHLLSPPHSSPLNSWCLNLLGKGNGYPRSQSRYFWTVSGCSPTHCSLCTSVDFGGEILVPGFPVWGTERKGLSLLLLQNVQLAFPFCSRKEERAPGRFSLSLDQGPTTHDHWSLQDLFFGLTLLK